ncbi:hypothetical protein QO009_003586 [Brevibacillus aydinogluensis]|uniref:Uncharacterized protein n=1 Tax=Brevibacillus aydinogluensis TaxID=927786 RepID=A0AA48RB82_9BACL|nr:hypothetical protein [Brevibacillus aydinogluensis]CAJ1001156.1 hypothetical protein BSPP4475_02290 [Brevibacillus aydinogluensis]
MSVRRYPTANSSRLNNREARKVTVIPSFRASRFCENAYGYLRYGIGSTATSLR